jgi:hypothetical protein
MEQIPAFSDQAFSCLWPEKYKSNDKWNLAYFFGEESADENDGRGEFNYDIL